MKPTFELTGPVGGVRKPETVIVVGGSVERIVFRPSKMVRLRAGSLVLR